MTFVPALLAVSLPEHPTFFDNLQFQFTGLLVVLFTLGLMSLVVTMIGRVFIALEKRHKLSTAAAPTSPSGAPGQVGSDSPIPGQIYAVIAAAVSTALGDRRVLIHGVHVADPRENLAWGVEGRRSIYAGKNLR